MGIGDANGIINDAIDGAIDGSRDFIGDVHEDIRETVDDVADDIGRIIDGTYDPDQDYREDLKTLGRPLMTLQMISVESSMALTTLIKTIVKILRLPHLCQLDPKKYQLLCHRSSPDQRKSSSVYPLTNYFIK